MKTNDLVLPVTLLSLLSTSIFALPSSSIFRPYGKIVKEKSYEIDLGGTYFSSTGQYEIDSSLTENSGNSSYTRTEGELSFRYGLSKTIEVKGGVRARMNDSVTTQSNNLDVEASNSGPESVLLSAKYGVSHKKKYLYAFEVGVRHTVFSPLGEDQATSTTEIELGDESTTFFADFEFSTRLHKKIVGQLELGVAVPSSPQSNEVYYDAGLIWYGKKFALLGGVNGVYSLEGDDYTDLPTSKPALATGNTNTINSINRSYMSPYVGLNYAFNNKFRVEFKGEQTIQGESWDEGTTFGVNIVYRKDRSNKADKVFKKFKDYTFEGSVVKVSPRGRFVKIDKGLSDDLAKGQDVDIYQFDYLGGNVLVASGKLYEVNVETSIIKILKVYRDIPVKVGFVVRGK